MEFQCVCVWDFMLGLMIDGVHFAFHRWCVQFACVMIVCSCLLSVLWRSSCWIVWIHGFGHVHRSIVRFHLHPKCPPIYHRSRSISVDRLPLPANKANSKCLKIVQSQLSSCHLIQWFNRMPLLPYSWDIVAPTAYHRMLGMRSVAASLFVCLHGNDIGPNYQNVKTCVECHLRWLCEEYSRQTLAIDHFSVKIDQNHLKWEK